MKSIAFDYVRAQSVEHASQLLREHGDDAKVLAGGQSLLPVMNFRLAHPTVLVDLGRIAELRTFERSGTGLRCGALVTHHMVEIAEDPALAGYAELSRIAQHIGHLPIRTRGTMGGSLAHADSASEWCLAALALDAVIVAQGTQGQRRIPAAEFFVGLFSTRLEPDEIVVAIDFPRPTTGTRMEQYARRRGDFAIVAAAADLVDRDGRCAQARIALGGVAGTPVRIPDAEAVLTGLDLTDRRGADDAVREAAYVCSNQIDTADDVHASTAYRRRLTRVLVDRALRGCLQDLDEEER